MSGERRRILHASVEQQDRARGISRKQLSHCLSTLFIIRLSKCDPRRAVSSSSSSRVGDKLSRSVKEWTRLPVLPRFFTLLLLLLDKPCKLPAVVADVDRLLRPMSRRPASLQALSAVLVTLKPATFSARF